MEFVPMLRPAWSGPPTWRTMDAWASRTRTLARMLTPAAWYQLLARTPTSLSFT